MTRSCGQQAQNRAPRASAWRLRRLAPAKFAYTNFAGLRVISKIYALRAHCECSRSSRIAGLTSNVLARLSACASRAHCSLRAAGSGVRAREADSRASRARCAPACASPSRTLRARENRALRNFRGFRTQSARVELVREARDLQVARENGVPVDQAW